MPNNIWRESLSRSILDLVEDKANIGSWSWDLSSGEMNWSVGVYRIFALSPSEAPDMSLIGNLLQGSEAATLRAANPLAIARFLADRKFTIRRRDGELRVVHSHGKLIGSSDQSNAQFVGAFLDITDSQLDDELFLLREALLDSMRQLFGVVIWQTDASGAVIDPLQWRMAVGVDSGAEGAWGRLQLVHPDDRETVAKAWVAAQENRKTYSCDFRMMRGGQYVSAHSQAVSLADTAGEILGWIGFTRVQDGSPVPDATAKKGNLSAAQIRAARGLLNWSGQHLAQRAGVSFSSVRRAEADGRNSVTDATIAAIRFAFEEHGIQFSEDGDSESISIVRRDRTR